ncbi:microtubule motor protein [Aureococcus anophagefferens]|uniref:Microtubule motor protein n=1 Tax=Aureococcus anophagefferens TaxID=44056 RepID=A0ABR1G405_AURAN
MEPENAQILQLQRDLAAELGSGLGEGGEFELERAKMVAQFGERCDAFRRYEERLERRARAAERRWKRDRSESDGLAAENSRLLRELDVARAYIETLQRSQRERLDESLRGDTGDDGGYVVSPVSDLDDSFDREDAGARAPRAPLPREKGVGLVGCAVERELVDLRRHAAALAAALDRAKRPRGRGRDAARAGGRSTATARGAAARVRRRGGGGGEPPRAGAGTRARADRRGEARRRAARGRRRRRCARAVRAARAARRGGVAPRRARAPRRPAARLGRWRGARVFLRDRETAVGRGAARAPRALVAGGRRGGARAARWTAAAATARARAAAADATARDVARVRDAAAAAPRGRAGARAGAAPASVRDLAGDVARFAAAADATAARHARCAAAAADSARAERHLAAAGRVAADVDVRAAAAERRGADAERAAAARAPRPDLSGARARRARRAAGARDALRSADDALAAASAAFARARAAERGAAARRRAAQRRPRSTARAPRRCASAARSGAERRRGRRRGGAGRGGGAARGRRGRRAARSAPRARASEVARVTAEVGLEESAAARRGVFAAKEAAEAAARDATARLDALEVEAARAKYRGEALEEALGASERRLAAADQAAREARAAPTRAARSSRPARPSRSVWARGAPSSRPARGGVAARRRRAAAPRRRGRARRRRRRGGAKGRGRARRRRGHARRRGARARAPRRAAREVGRGGASRAAVAGGAAATSEVVAEAESTVAALEGRVEAARADAATAKAAAAAAKADAAALRRALDEAREAAAEATFLAKLDPAGAYDDRERRARRARLALEESLAVADATRRRLHNALQELRGSVRVVARLRPPSGLLRDDAPAPAVRAGGAGRRTVVLAAPPRDGVDGGAKPRKLETLRFDRVFDGDATQADVYGEIDDLVASAADGFDVCVLAYGATGSGKTHTMHGPASGGDEAGVVPRATRALAEAARRRGDGGWSFACEASSVEIYDERVYDLLAPGGAALEVKDDADDPVPGAAALPLDFGDDGRGAAQLAKRAARSRRTAATLLNDRSSRSHALFTLRIVGHHEAKNLKTRGSLVLVDLAGSERLKRSGAADPGADPGRLREACAINRSLSCLVDVFAALGRRGDGRGRGVHVPYRNSALTRILQRPLSGDGKALLLATCNPHEAESLGTLKFAHQVAAIETGRIARRVSSAAKRAPLGAQNKRR